MRKEVKKPKIMEGPTALSQRIEEPLNVFSYVNLLKGNLCKKITKWGGIA